MGVLINGMEMPTRCSACPMLEGESYGGLCHAANKWLDDDEFWTWFVYPEGDVDDSKPCNCPLVSVPPHGRLIDADALDKQIYNDIPLKVFGNIARRAEMRNIVYHAPTIIEAEEEDE